MGGKKELNIGYSFKKLMEKYNSIRAHLRKKKILNEGKPKNLKEKIEIYMIKLL